MGRKDRNEASAAKAAKKAAKKAGGGSRGGARKGGGRDKKQPGWKSQTHVLRLSSNTSTRDLVAAVVAKINSKSEKMRKTFMVRWMCVCVCVCGCVLMRVRVCVCLKRCLLWVTTTFLHALD